jgi:hypothetical protein
MSGEGSEVRPGGPPRVSELHLGYGGVPGSVPDSGPLRRPNCPMSGPLCAHAHMGINTVNLITSLVWPKSAGADQLLLHHALTFDRSPTKLRSLPEFSVFFAPILRRIARQDPDA